MMINPNCGYFNEERDDEYAPPYGMCEECYRYDLCRRVDIEKKITKLEHVSGESIDELIRLFAAGWKLNSPDTYKITLSEVYNILKKE